MFSTALLYCLLGIHLSVAAQPEENKPQNSEGAAPIISFGKPAREEAILQVVEFVKREDTQLKERLQESYTDLKELLKEGDANLKERMLEGDEQLKEQLKEGDSRLKEELEGDVAWLKGKMEKLEARMTEDLAEQRDACEKRKDSNKAGEEMLVEDLRRQMCEFQAELKKTQAELNTTKDELLMAQAELNNTKEQLQAQIDNSQDQLQTQLDDNKEQLQTLHRGQGSSQNTLQALQDTVLSLSRGMTAARDSHSGSTFTRWGSSSCPDNTSLVYSGVAGGSYYDQVGGAANYLCLVLNPQLDDTVAVNHDYFDHLYGAEYEGLAGERDVLCSVCRTPESITIMVPATLTCPGGWNRQYTGYLATNYRGYKRTEYVCVDQVREHADRGQADQEGALFYHVITKCGSLPCPPYEEDKVVTCVVCSV